MSRAEGESRMPRRGGLDHYQVLEIDYGANYKEIKAAYRRLLRQHGDDERELRLVKEAWSVLSDAVLRKRYDQRIKVAERRLRSLGTGKPSSSRDAAGTAQGFSSAEERARKPLSSTEVMTPDISKTDVLSRMPDTQILDTEDESKSFHPLEGTLILAPNEDPDHQPASPTHMDDTVTRVRDEKELRIDVVEVALPDDTQEEYSLSKEKTTIGRRGDNDIVLRDPQKYVSRQHASIVRRATQYYVVDHDSANGTFLRGKRIPANREIPFKDGETIDIEGRKLTLRLRAH